MLKLTKLLLVLFLLIILPANAQETVIQDGSILTLENCIDIAIKNNPTITLEKNITNVYKSRVGQVKSGYFPQVNLSSGYSRQNQMVNTDFDNNNNQYSGTIGLNQLLYDFGKTPTKVKIQDLNFNSSKADVDTAIISVSYAVKQAYYSALSAKISRDIYSQTIKQYERHLKQAQAFFTIGTKPKIDVITAEVNLSNAKLNYIKANNTYKTSMANLNNAIGITEAPAYDIADTLTFRHIGEPPQGTEIDVADKSFNNKSKTNENAVLKTQITKNEIFDNLTLKKYEISFEDALKTAIENRPDLKSILIKSNAANESVKLAKKDYLPGVSGFANYGFGGREFPLDNGWAVGANLSVPVFNGGLIKNQVNEAKANLDIAKTEVEILKQNIYLQVKQAYINLTEAEKRIPVANITIKQAKEYLELANGRYKAGVGNSIELQDAEVNYNNAQLTYVQSLYDYNTSRSTLEKAMGVK